MLPIGLINANFPSAYPRSAGPLGTVEVERSTAPRGSSYGISGSRGEPDAVEAEVAGDESVRDALANMGDCQSSDINSAQRLSSGIV